MRARLTLASALLLAACIPQVDAPKGPSRPRSTEAVEPGRAAQQCLAALPGEGIRFRRLPDRLFDGGCSAIGTVQLLDIGTPVPNLGPMTCPLARNFARWVRETVQPAAQEHFGVRVSRIESFGTYSCRPVNNQSGARLSEHGRSNAVDLSAFVLANGRRITVLSGWNGPDEDARAFMRQVHRGGCRHFQVGLGPDANALHRDHFHFDMGRGPYCR